MTDSHCLKLAVILSLAAAASCAGEGDDGAAYADVVLVDSRQVALQGSDVQSINGSYTGCSNRTGDWSLPVTGNPTLDNPLLTVIQNDTGCTLALTDIITGTDGKLTAGTPITLAATYGTAQPFGSPIKYYANAILSSVSFASNFTLTLLFSDDPRIGTGSTTATYSSVSATAATQGVTAPNYTLDLTGVTVTADVSKISVSVSGNVALTGTITMGDTYVIVNTTVGNTYAAINTAYLAGSSAAVAATIPASSFLATSVNLTTPVVRSLIIARTQNGVRAYQKFAITFNGPP